MPQRDAEQEAKAQEFREEFQQKMMAKILSGGDTPANSTDPELMYVLKEIRDNTARIARALEEPR